MAVAARAPECALTMDDLRLTRLAARVVAWHNRHPLARRIQVAQVHSMGYVALPFLAPAPAQLAGVDGGAAAAAGAASLADSAGAGEAVDVDVEIVDAVAASGAVDVAVDIDVLEAATLVNADAGSVEAAAGSLRERAMARAQQAPAAPPAPPAPPAAPAAAATAAAPQPDSLAKPAAGPTPVPGPMPRLEAAFDETILPPLSPAQVARWVTRHGVATGPALRDAPVRRVQPLAGADASRIHTWWVLTAQIEIAGVRTRLLVGAGERAAVLGRRLWSPGRVVVPAALVGALCAVAAMLLAPQATGRGAARAAASAVGSGMPASAPAPATVVAAASAAGAAAAPVADSASAPAAARPVDVEPTLGRVNLPSLGPLIDERRSAAALVAAPSAAAASASGAASEPAAVRPPPAASAPAPAPPVAAAAGGSFAVSTRLLRTRTEGEQLAAAMRALLLTPGAPPLRVELLPVGDDWRVVGLPYSERAAAEKARALLAARGMKVEVVDF